MSLSSWWLPITSTIFDHSSSLVHRLICENRLIASCLFSSLSVGTMTLSLKLDNKIVRFFLFYFINQALVLLY